MRKTGFEALYPPLVYVIATGCLLKKVMQF